MRMTFEGDASGYEVIRNQVMGVVRSVRAMKAATGMLQLIRSFDLPGGEQVYVVNLEHEERVHVVFPSPPVVVEYRVDIEPEVVQTIGVADYVSGAVVSPTIVQIPVEETDDPEDMADAVNRVDRTRKTEDRIPLDLARRKLAVEEDAAFAPLRTGALAELRFTEHASILPGYYTGRMRQVAQVLLGAGKQLQRTFESREILAGRLPLVAPANDDTVSAFGLYGPEEAQPVEVRMQYDYRSNRTHGLSWGSDGRCYLVEIGQRGVHIMPLELDPASLDAAGRARYQALYPELDTPDDSGQSFFDAIGGFPTGRRIPVLPDDLNDYVKAGEVVRAVTSSGMAPFYSGNSVYSTACGWAFNQSGSRADNTCYGAASNGVLEGAHYSVRISIGAFAPRQASPSVSRIISGLGLRGVAANKALRLTEAQVQMLLDMEPGAAQDAFDALEVDADFTATATLGLVKRGYLYSPGNLIPKNHCDFWSGQPQIKFAEPFLGKLLSFDFAPPTLGASVKRCDTPMYVFYVGDSLTVVNYFYQANEPSQPREEGSTRAPCQFTGTWYDYSYGGGSHTHGNFYTTHTDARKVITQDGTSVRKTTGTFEGYSYYMSFCAFFAMHATIVTKVHHSYEWDNVVAESHGYNASVAIPLGDRSLYYVATLDTTVGKQHSWGWNAPSVSGIGPAVRHGMIYHFVFHWAGHCAEGWPTYSWPEINTPLCRLTEYRPMTYQASCFQDAPEPPIPDYMLTPYHRDPAVAAQLSAQTGCSGNKSYLNADFITWPPAENQKLFKGESWTEIDPIVNVFDWKVRLFGDTHLSGRVVRQEKVEAPGAVFYDTQMSPWWWLPSPTDCGVYATLNAVVNRWGSDLIAYQPQFDDNTSYSGYPDEMRLGPGVCYVGWVE